jgi:hypothetical protein
LNYLFQNTVGHRSQVAAEEKSLPETLTTACPRGFLAGAIVKMWVAHRLDWAGEYEELLLFRPNL